MAAEARCLEALRQALALRPEVAIDPTLCRALLNDLLAEASIELRAQIQVLVDAVALGAPRRLRAGDSAVDVATQLTGPGDASSNMGIWAVTTWSQALGVKTPDAIATEPAAPAANEETREASPILPTMRASGTRVAPWNPDTVAKTATPDADRYPYPQVIDEPHARTGAGRRRGLLIGAAVLLVAAGVAVGVISTQNDSARQSTSTEKIGPTTSAVPAAQGTSRKTTTTLGSKTLLVGMDRVLHESSATRTTVGRISDTINNTGCSLSPSDAVVQVTGTQAQRRRQLSELKALPSVAVPRVTMALQDAKVALQASIDSYDAWITWLQGPYATAVANGCDLPTANTGPVFAALKAAFQAASDAKQTFVLEYNPLAAGVGLPASWTAGTL